MRQKRTFHIRNIVLFFLATLLVIGIGYKYFEWKTFSDVSNSYNTSYFDELKFVSEMGPSSDELTNEMLNNKQFNHSKNSSDYLQGLGTVENKLDVVINNEEGYLDLLKSKLALFSQLQIRTNLLLGERGSIGKKIVNNQVAYYQDEIKGTNIYLGTLYADQILYEVYRDQVALNDFSNAVGSSTNASYISQYFYEIAALEKYTNGNFKFDKEDFVNNYFPSFVSKINDKKKYFSAYYMAEKDFTVGNTDTAQLELQAAIDTWSNTQIDYSSLYKEQYSTATDIDKDVLILVSDQAAAIKDYKSKQLFKYPLLKEVSVWKEDFVLCQMYDFKSSVYHTITSNYPVSKNIPDLIKELSSISPKTDNVDRTFDKTAMEFTNTDKALEFTCTDKYTGEKLNFTYTKSF